MTIRHVYAPMLRDVTVTRGIIIGAAARTCFSMSLVRMLRMNNCHRWLTLDTSRMEGRIKLDVPDVTKTRSAQRGDEVRAPTAVKSSGICSRCAIWLTGVPGPARIGTFITLAGCQDVDPVDPPRPYQRISADKYIMD